MTDIFNKFDSFCLVLNIFHAAALPKAGWFNAYRS